MEYSKIKYALMSGAFLFSNAISIEAGTTLGCSAHDSSSEKRPNIVLLSNINLIFCILWSLIVMNKVLIRNGIKI